MQLLIVKWKLLISIFIIFKSDSTFIENSEYVIDFFSSIWSIQLQQKLNINWCWLDRCKFSSEQSLLNILFNYNVIWKWEMNFEGTLE